MNLSPTMMQVTEQMELHGELIRYPGGFWSWRDVEIKREIPVWYCDVKTLRALGKRGIVNLDETKKICKLNRYFEEDMMKKYLLGGASQNAAQWDGSRYIINHGELITLVKRRWLRDSLFRVESDGRIVQIGSDIIDRYFTILF